MVRNINQLVADVSSTRLFARIKNVAFLGIVDWVNTAGNTRKSAFSRAQHSIGVLGLGVMVAQRGAFSGDEAAHLFAACLVHDLGHPPFSHSLEYAFPKGANELNHHDVLREILLSPSGQDRELVRALVNHDVSPERVFAIVNGEDKLSFFFNSPLNIDTLDGISRSLWSLGAVPSFKVNVLANYLARLYDGGEFGADEFKRNADDFWVSKGAFYSMLSSNSRLASAERNFQAAVRKRMTRLERGDFRMDDRQFASRYPDIMLETTSGAAIQDEPVRQDFVVDKSVDVINKNNIDKRYRRVRHASSGLSRISS